MSSTDKLKISYVSITKLKFADYNPRQLSKKEFSDIRNSLEEFGFAVPILVNQHPKRNNVIIGGHQRVRVAKDLGYKTIPCVFQSLTLKKERELNIRLNRNSGSWDWDALANNFEPTELEDWGFDEADFSFIDFHEPEGGEDDYQIPDEIKTNIVLGDVIEIGPHRLMCGDAKDRNSWNTLKIPAKTVCFTSPPYNLGSSISIRKNQSKNNKKKDRKLKLYESYNDNQSPEQYMELLQHTLTHAINFCDAAAYNVQMLAGNKITLIEWLFDNKDNLVDILTWHKGHAAPAIAKGVCSSTFEWICIFNKHNNSRSIPLSSWRGKISNVYEGPPQMNNEFAKNHGATFPLHLPGFVIKDLMNKCEGVVDCFIGTGTTMVAAHQLNKKCYGMEIDPKYCQVTLNRMIKLDSTLLIKINGKKLTASQIKAFN